MNRSKPRRDTEIGFSLSFLNFDVAKSFFNFRIGPGAKKKFEKKSKIWKKIWNFFQVKKIQREKGHFSLVGQSDPKSELFSLLF